MTWDIVLFENLYRIPSKNGLYKSSKFEGKGFPIVKMKQQFSQGFINSEKSKFDLIELNESELKKNEVLINDLLFSRTSVVAEGVGKCSIVQYLAHRTIFDSNIIRLRLDSNKACSLFYYYYFKSFIGRGEILSLSNGVNIKTIKGSDLKRLNVPQPKLETQKRIANILSVYDDLIENNLKRIKLLEQAAQNIYKEWFVNLRFPGYENTPINEETGLLVGWEEKMLSDFIEFKNGKSLKDKELSKKYIVYGSNGIIGKSSVFNREDTIIIGRVGAYCGSINYCKNKFWATDNTITAKAISSISTNVFCELLLRNLDLRRFASGAAQPLLTQRTINGLKVSLPPFSLINKFTLTADLIKKQTDNLSNLNLSLKAARDILLPRLMNRTIEI